MVCCHKLTTLPSCSLTTGIYSIRLYAILLVRVGQCAYSVAIHFLFLVKDKEGAAIKKRVHARTLHPRERSNIDPNVASMRELVFRDMYISSRQCTQMSFYCQGHIF